MTENKIIVDLNNIAAKHGYGGNAEKFTNDEWNSIFTAKEIIKDYSRLTEENIKLKEQVKEFDVLYTRIKDGQLDMSVRGTTLKAITACFIQAFIQNGGTNFFLYDLKDDKNNKYSVTIQKAEGKTPVEILSEYKQKSNVAERAFKNIITIFYDVLKQLPITDKPPTLTEWVEEVWQNAKREIEQEE